LDVVEQKESCNSKASGRRRQKRDKVVFKKRELAEWQAAKAAAHESQQDAMTGALVVPDAAMYDGAADADLNNHIDEIENDMQQTYEEFQNM
jgi:hypothetical protein